MFPPKTPLQGSKRIIFKAKAQKDKEIKREDCSNILQARKQMDEWLLT